MNIFMCPETNTCKYYVFFTSRITFGINVELVKHIVREGQNEMVRDSNLPNVAAHILNQDTTMHSLNEKYSLESGIASDNMSRDHSSNNCKNCPPQCGISINEDKTSSAHSTISLEIALLDDQMAINIAEVGAQQL